MVRKFQNNINNFNKKKIMNNYQIIKKLKFRLMKNNLYSIININILFYYKILILIKLIYNKINQLML